MTAKKRSWYDRLGPDLITACVVIGPGSILTSSQVGAKHGYALLWVVVTAVLFMLTYTTLASKLGIVARRPAADLITERAGRWLAILIGLGAFFISAAYQFGNNLGVHSALAVYTEDLSWNLSIAGIDLDPFDYMVVLFNALSISFLFGFRNLYRALERLMIAFVALMLFSFALNLYFARPDPTALLSGLVPAYSAETWDLSLLGLVGTTFVITAAYYQSYLVRQKGWGEEEMRSGLFDARIGAVIMALITVMLMSTAAVLLTTIPNSVQDVAVSLEPLLGPGGQAVFCLGLFAAAYSSFLVNSMIGGFILCDGLGLPSHARALAPRLFTTAVLLVGMFVGLYLIKTGTSPVPAIVTAQATTVLAAPLMAGVLLWLTNCKSIMGEHRNGPVLNLCAVAGLLLLLAMAGRLAVQNVWPAISAALQSG